jgi:hypothetical protein
MTIYGTNNAGEQMSHTSNHIVEFHGESIIAIQDRYGSVYVPLKRLCRHLGIDHNRQTSKVKEDERFNCRLMSATGTDGKKYKMLCIPEGEIFAWLLTICPNRVRADLKEKLIRYQKECFDVLNAYWTKGRAVNPRRYNWNDDRIDGDLRQRATSAFDRFCSQELVPEDTLPCIY